MTWDKKNMNIVSFFVLYLPDIELKENAGVSSIDMPLKGIYNPFT